MHKSYYTGHNLRCYFGLCICNDTWYGKICNETCPIFDNNNCNDCCQNDAECYYDKCICTNGYYGEYCEKNSFPNITQYENDTTKC